MTAKMIMCISEIAAVLDRYGATLGYTTSDDGVHVEIGHEDVCIGFISAGHARTKMDATLNPPNARLDRPDGAKEAT